MANHYMMKYKGTYRVLAKLDSTNDIPRDRNGDIADGYDDLYITCQHGNEISYYGHKDGNSRVSWLIAYIPSIGRGRNIIKAIKELGIEYEEYVETDSEVLFHFKAKDIEPVATLMKAKTSGANISPFSTRNLPKSNVKIPTEEITRYKEISALVEKSDLLLIHKVTTSFLSNVVEKTIRRKDKNFKYRTDMKQMCMGRQAKEYIYVKGFWEEYLTYLKKEINKFYKDK